MRELPHTLQARLPSPSVRPRGFVLALFFALTLLAYEAATGRAEEGERKTLSGEFDDQQFVAGETVYVDAIVRDEIFAAGGDVTFEGASANTMIVAGHRLTVRGSAVDDAIMAGGGLSFEGEIADDMVAAICPFCPLSSNRLHIRETAVIGDDARLASRLLDVDGTIGGDLYAAASEFTLSGEVAGNVSVLADRVVIAPDARIGGDLSYRSPNEPEIAGNAVIGGEVAKLDAPWLDDADFEREGGGIWSWFLIVLALVVFGAVVQLVAPGLIAAAGTQARKRTWSSLGIGFVVLIVTPIVVVLLFVTIVGAPLAVFTIPLFFVALGFALATIASVVGDRLRRFTGRSPKAATTLGKLAWFAAGMIVLAIVGAVPFVGGVVVLIALLVGLGAVVRQMLPLLRSPAPT